MGIPQLAAMYLIYCDSGSHAMRAHAANLGPEYAPPTARRIDGVDAAQYCVSEGNPHDAVQPSGPRPQGHEWT